MPRRIPVLALVGFLVTACAAPAGPAASSPSPASPVAAAVSPSGAATSGSGASPSTVTDPWAEDLAAFDEGVRKRHPDPFAIHPESEWTSTLAALPEELEGATLDQQLVRLSKLVGLLDTHSYIALPGGYHAYDLLPYRFADGWYIVAAVDPSLVGSRLVSVNGTSAEDLEAMIRPLIPSDNESGDLDGIEGPMVYVEWLTGLGVVTDPAMPGFLLERPDGSQVTVNPASRGEEPWAEQLGILGDLIAGFDGAPEAVARRGAPAWYRLDKPTKTFVLSYNDYEEQLLPKAVEAMQAALADGSATRVVLDMRYLRGGNGSLAQPLLDAFRYDKRFKDEGLLTVLIGRENVSAGTLVASTLDATTGATFVGESTPARADNFLCPCHEIRLPSSGFIVSVPTYQQHTGDTRDAIRPDVEMALSAKDFFAGRDPVLDAVLAGS